MGNLGSCQECTVDTFQGSAQSWDVLKVSYEDTSHFRNAKYSTVVQMISLNIENSSVTL